MLDVHPPHHAANTWRDFFLHIATIVVGLLIAIGLEQTVEFFHDRHLRHELQQQLHEQSADSVDFIERDVKVTEAYIDWAATQSAAIKASQAGQALQISQLPDGALLFPDTGVWLSAKDNGRTALLPPQQQIWYTDLYRIEQRSFAPGIGALDRLQSSLSALDQLLAHTAVIHSGDTLDLSALTADERASCSQALSAVLESSRDLERELLMYDAANHYLLKISPDHWSDSDVINEYLRLRNKNYVAHPSSQYIFTAR